MQVNEGNRAYAGVEETPEYLPYNFKKIGSGPNYVVDRAPRDRTSPIPDIPSRGMPPSGAGVKAGLKPPPPAMGPGTALREPGYGGLAATSEYAAGRGFRPPEVGTQPSIPGGPGRVNIGTLRHTPERSPMYALGPGGHGEVGSATLSDQLPVLSEPPKKFIDVASLPGGGVPYQR